MPMNVDEMNAFAWRLDMLFRSLDKILKTEARQDLKVVHQMVAEVRLRHNLKNDPSMSPEQQPEIDKRLLQFLDNL